MSIRLPQMHRKSVCLCELWQEGGAYGKAPPARPLSPLLFLRTCFAVRYPLNLWITPELVV
ncbi:MAG: hypothetical protein EBR59_10145 [Methylococcaceae bacterium]|nr:hypothetical protein [Methylococcaceae bacterium]